MRRLLLAVMSCAALLIAGAALAVPASAADPDLNLFLALPAGPQGGIGHGTSGAYGVTVIAPAGTTSGILTITLPSAVQASVTSAEGSAGAGPWPCAPTSTPDQSACAIDFHGSFNLINVVVAVAPSAPIGATGQVTFAVSLASGTDPDPSNNALSAPITVNGLSDLRYELTPSPTAVPNGGTATLSLTVTNLGPDPAPATVADLLFAAPAGAFAFAGFDSPDVTFTSTAPTFPPLATWSIGDLGVGQTAVLNVTVSGATDDAQGRIDFSVRSAYPDPICENNACLFRALLAATPAAAPTVEPTSEPSQPAAVPAADPSDPPAPPTDAPVEPAASAAQPQLAATGRSAGAPLIAGLACMVMGALLVGAACGSRRAASQAAMTPADAAAADREGSGITRSVLVR